jgi:type 1 glutamine amidotransferase
MKGVHVSAGFIPDLAAGPSSQNGTMILVFSKTTGYRHDSISNGTQMLRDLGAANEFLFDFTEDSTAFSRERLAPYAAVVWLSVSGDVLDSTQRSAFEGYIRQGGGYVGIHASSDAEYSWPFYRALVGTSFRAQPGVQPAVVFLEDTQHESTRNLPQPWARIDEWFDFQSNPRETVHVLATVDESTYVGGSMGPDHPVAWCHSNLGGRSWYTAMGHTAESFSDVGFQQHVLGGIVYASHQQERPV